MTDHIFLPWNKKVIRFSEIFYYFVCIKPRGKGYIVIIKKQIDFLLKVPENGTFSKKLLLMNTVNDIRLEEWIEKLQTRGKYAFSTEMIESELPDYSGIAVKRALSRLTAKNKIISIYKGYYLIIPPQYAAPGILPPSLFLDAFMGYLHRPYYLALLNAASYHGAAHQQPQEFVVVTGFPVLRPSQKKGLKINYISICNIPENLLEQRKTESGYLTISNPVLTATDIVRFEKRIGGLNRAATVLKELSEGIIPDSFDYALLQFTSVTILQRLGYLLEYPCNKGNLANSLFDLLQVYGKELYRIPLKASAPIKGFSSANRWKVIVNTEIEIDE